MSGLRDSAELDVYESEYVSEPDKDEPESESESELEWPGRATPTTTSQRMIWEAGPVSNRFCA